jgi:hypothetical protein
VHPFNVTKGIDVRIEAPTGPAWLLLWPFDDNDDVGARTFNDAAPVEAPTAEEPGQTLFFRNSTGRRRSVWKSSSTLQTERLPLNSD